MKKKIFPIFVFITLISLPVVMPAEAYLEQVFWANPKRRDYYDNYYGEWVEAAYDEGAEASLLINVQNDIYPTDAYSIRVKVLMDWAVDNLTSGGRVIPQGQTHWFGMEIDIPGVTNQHLHSYTIYVEYKSDTTWVLDTMTTRTDLAIYSEQQSEAISYEIELDAYPTHTYIPFLSSSKTHELIINASLHENVADQNYERGNFTCARDHYKIALDYTRQAYATDTEYLGKFEDALVDLIDAGQSYLSFQGLAFFIASVGFLIMGIGVIVYLVRRSKPPAS